MSLKKGILIDVIMLLVFAVGAIGYLTIAGVSTQQTTQAVVHSSPTITLSPTPVTMANPASVYCSQVGGKLVILKRGDGGEYGLCQFQDNQACEEWALYRKECPIGGVKTTGFDTIQEKYCAWIGGKTIADPKATCTLPNKKVCKNTLLYNGQCSLQESSGS